MTQEELIGLAKEAGIFTSDNLCATVTIEVAERFAALVAAAQRERIAEHFSDSDYFMYRSEVAAAIRAGRVNL